MTTAISLDYLLGDGSHSSRDVGHNVPFLIDEEYHWRLEGILQNNPTDVCGESDDRKNQITRQYVHRSRIDDDVRGRLIRRRRVSSQSRCVVRWSLEEGAGRSWTALGKLQPHGATMQRVFSALARNQAAWRPFREFP